MSPAPKPAPFRLLRHFFWNGFFESEMLAEGTDLRSALVTVGLLVGTPALPLALYLAMAGAANATAITLFFISLSMACMAVATAILWPKLLPDESDLRVLRPLPLGAPLVLRAKLAALAGLLATLALLINIYAVTAIPAAMPQRGSLARLILANVLATAGAAALSFFALMSVYTALIAALGSRRALRAAPLLQFLALTAATMGLIVSPYLLELPARMVTPHPAAWLRAAPPMWFLGLQKVLAGAANPPVLLGRATRLAAGNGDPIWWWYARRGLFALAIAFVVALVLYLAAFRRQWRDALEAEPVAGGWRLLPRMRTWFAGWALPTARERSLFQFMAQTLERHPQPRLILAVAGALGLAIAGTNCLGAVLGSASHAGADFRAAFFAAPLVVCFFLLLGLRYAFSMPVDLPARWIFRTGDDAFAADARAVMRAALWFYALVPPALVWAPAALARWGVATAAWTTAWDLAAAGIAAELLLPGVRRVPFTTVHQTTTIVRRTMLPLGWVAVAYIAGRIAAWEARPVDGAAVLILVAAVVGLLVAMRRVPVESEPFELALSYDEPAEWAVQHLFVE